MRRARLLIGALGLVLAACGGSDGADEPTASSADPTTTTVAVVTPETESFHPDDAGWELVWSDEFDGTGLDLSRWSYEQNCWGGGNNELQCYTDAPANSEVRDGLLVIRALEETATGLAVSEDSPDAATAGTRTLPYTSARIRSKDKGDWRYGRFEIRARLPFGQGLWPAIWMLPTDSVYGTWAASGEIDIMEATNLKASDDVKSRSVLGTLHYGGEFPANVESGAFWPISPDLHPSDVFHVYAVEWEEGEIRWYLDDTHYATQTSDGWYSQTDVGGELVIAPGAAPFDQAFHLILNVAVGGNLPGDPDDTTTFPQVMEVDYVRVYECAASPDDGTGCATTSDLALQVAGNRPPASPPTTQPADDTAGGFDPADLGDTMAVFEDEPVAPWRLDASSGGATVEIIDTGEPGYGAVVQATFTGNETVVYLQAGTGYDLSDWADGFVEFDLRVVDRGTNTGGFVMKVDCGFPCGSGDYLLDDPVVGEWTTYRIAVADLLTNPGSTLDLSRVDTPLVIFPAWGNQQGAVIQVDNVAWTR